MKVNQDLKCFFGLHKYEVYKEEEVKDYRDVVVAKSIINRCTNCGKIKVNAVSLIKTI